MTHEPDRHDERSRHEREHGTIRPKLPLAAYRRRQIILILERDGHVDLNDLHRYFAVSEASLRRDLRSIADAGLGIRVRGGLRSRRAETER